MPFEGASIPAPIMAAKQGMMDVALHGVSDQAQSVVRYVSGSLTGKGSGLLQPVTQSAQNATQSALSQASQTGQAMSLGKGEFWGAGQTTGTSGDSWSGALAQATSGVSGGSNVSSLVGAMAGAGAGSIAGPAGAAQPGGGVAAMATPALGGSGGAPGGIGSSVATAASVALSGGSGDAGDSRALWGLAPGTSATAPQFNALPQIPSMTRLQGVLSRLGGVAGPGAAAAIGALAGGASGDQTGSSMQQAPGNQFAGSGTAASYEADS